MLTTLALKDVASVSITDTNARYVITALIIGCLLVGLHALLHPDLRRRTLWAALGSVCAGLAAYLGLEHIFKPFPDSVPLSIYAAGTAATFVVAAAVLQRGRRIPVALAAIIAIICGMGVANLTYQQFPTLRSLDPLPRAVTYDSLEALPDSPPEIDGRTVGALVTLDIPGTQSGFHARPAVAYLPPAYFEQQRAKENFPLLVLMAGNPGRPIQWFGAGGAEGTLDDYQADHDGYSPIVVSVDATGSFLGNPICVDGPKDKVQTYLAKDVPARLEKVFRVDPTRRAIGGLSYGGTCALQVVTNHPHVYRTFLDFSGQWEPTIGTHAETVRVFFGGDEAAFDAVNPASILARNAGTDTFAGVRGSFIAGVDDPESVQALKKLNALAQAAGMDTSFHTVAGGHSYQVWRKAFRQELDMVVSSPPDAHATP